MKDQFYLDSLELEGVKKEAMLSYFAALSRYCLDRLSKRTTYFSLRCCCRGKNSERTIPEFRSMPVYSVACLIPREMCWTWSLACSHWFFVSSFSILIPFILLSFSFLSTLFFPVFYFFIVLLFVPEWQLTAFFDSSVVQKTEISNRESLCR